MMHLITVVIAIVLMAVLGSTARADVEIRVSNTTESTQITTGSATVTNNDETTATAFDPPPEGTAASGSVIGVVSEPPSEESQSETQDEDQAREQSETQDEDQAREQSEGFSSGTRVSEHINV